jgi:hypothetical protein
MRFPTKTLYILLISAIRVPNPSHYHVLGLIIATVHTQTTNSTVLFLMRNLRAYFDPLRSKYFAQNLFSKCRQTVIKIVKQLLLWTFNENDVLALYVLLGNFHFCDLDYNNYKKFRKCLCFGGWF